MSENRPNRPANTGNPWMRPMGTQQLTRAGQSRQAAPAPISPYTPNEPDGNEAIYAARAAAARQQAANRQMPAYRTPEAPAPVQQAVEEAAMQAHTARMNARPQQSAYGQPAYQQSAPQMPARPAQSAAAYRQAERPQATNEVFYQQSTGVQQPARPAQPVQPAQPHRMPVNPYAYAAQSAQSAMPQQQPMHRPAAAPVQMTSISRQADAAALADPMLMEEAAQAGTTRRRSRMVMRQEQEPSQQQTSNPVAPPEDRRIFERPASQEPVQPVVATPVPEPRMPEVPKMPELEPVPAAPVAEAAPAAPADQSLESLLSGYSWAAADEEEEGEDCMDTSAMPIPAPVNTFDIPKVKRGKKLFTLLLVAMLLAAAAGFLWVSGYGEKLYHGATELIQDLKSDAVPTGALTISPETAALPAIVTVSLTTEDNISGLKLVDGDGNELPAQVAYTAHEDGIQWICTLRMSEPYTGSVCTQLLCEDGQWRPGSEKGHIQLQ